MSGSIAGNEQGFVSVQEFEKQMFKQLMQPIKDKMLKLSTSSLYCTKPRVIGSARVQKLVTSKLKDMNTKEIKEMIEVSLPEFVKAVETENADTIILHQTAFSENEIELLGAAIKYAGYFNKNITVII